MSASLEPSEEGSGSGVPLREWSSLKKLVCALRALPAGATQEQREAECAKPDYAPLRSMFHNKRARLLAAVEDLHVVEPDAAAGTIAMVRYTAVADGRAKHSWVVPLELMLYFILHAAVDLFAASRGSLGSKRQVAPDAVLLQLKPIFLPGRSNLCAFFCQKYTRLFTLVASPPRLPSCWLRLSD